MVFTASSVMQGQTNRQILGEYRQRALRNHATDPERALWRRLKGRQLEGCKFRRQHPFADFILDFACLEQRVVIELDGNQHSDTTAYDEARSAWLRAAGFVVLRFWNNEVFQQIEGVLEAIRRELVGRVRILRTPSPPNPPLEGQR